MLFWVSDVELLGRYSPLEKPRTIYATRERRGGGATFLPNIDRDMVVGCVNAAAHRRLGNVSEKDLQIKSEAACF